MTNALDSKIGISPSHLMSLGHLTIVSSLLEHALSAAIWRLSGMDGFDGVIITDRMNSQRKLDIIRILMSQRHPNAAEDFEQLYSRLHGAVRARNDAIHGFWLLDSPRPGKAHVFKFTTGGTLKFYAADLTAEEIDDMAKEIGQVGLDLLTFLDEHGVAPFEINPPPAFAREESEQPTDSSSPDPSPTSDK